MLVSDEPRIWLRYTVKSLGFDRDDRGVEAKHLTGWLDNGGDLIGMVQLDERYLDMTVTPQRFLDATDSFSHATADFGWAVASGRAISRFAGVRPLVELSRVWMRPDYANDCLGAAAVRALIKRRYVNRLALLMLNTWPADYKAQEARELDCRGLDTWNQRRTSIGRLAHAVLGVRPLPTGCTPEDPWWQWRAFSEGVPRPRKR